MKAGGDRQPEPGFRSGLLPSDPGRIRDLVTATGFFNAEEVGIAGELAEEWLARGSSSGYSFLLAEAGGCLVGYTCFGRIPGTVSSWDVYWIVVTPGWQGGGLGQALMARTELAIRAAGGTRIYVDTSSRPQYEPTRRFYRKCGYEIAAELPGFYGPDDGKVIFVRAP